MTDEQRTICPGCHHSIRVLRGTIVEHQAQPGGMHGVAPRRCPGSGLGTG